MNVSNLQKARAVRNLTAGIDHLNLIKNIGEKCEVQLNKEIKTYKDHEYVTNGDNLSSRIIYFEFKNNNSDQQPLQLNILNDDNWFWKTFAKCLNNKLNEIMTDVYREYKNNCKVYDLDRAIQLKKELDNLIQFYQPS